MILYLQDMPDDKNVLETVALKIDLPEDELVVGQVGTVVEELEPDVYLVIRIG